MQLAVCSVRIFDSAAAAAFSEGSIQQAQYLNFGMRIAECGLLLNLTLIRSADRDLHPKSPLQNLKCNDGTPIA